MLHPYLQYSFKAAKCFGTETDREHLTTYSNKIANKFFNNQLMYYPNGQWIIDSWVIHSGDLFDTIIIDNDISMNEMHTVKLSALLLEGDDVFEIFKKI